MDKTSFTKEVGALCRSCRERVGLRQVDIAEKVGMEPTNVCYFEQGKRDSLQIFSVYGMMFDAEEWRALNGIYNRYFAE